MLGDPLLPAGDARGPGGHPAAAGAGGDGVRADRRSEAHRGVARRVRLPPELRRRRSPGPASASRSSTRTASTNARPRPPYGVHAPICSPAGSPSSAATPSRASQVWSRDEGYPGDAFYREFYRDIGFDLPVSELHGRGRGRRLAADDGPEVLPHHGQGRREAAVPARRRRRAGGRARGQLRLQPRGAGQAPRWLRCRCRPSWWRPTTRSSTATGGSRGRCSSSRCSARLREAGGRLEAVTLRAVPRPPPGLRAGHAERELVGRGRLRRGLGRARRRRGRGGTCTTPRATPSSSSTRTAAPTGCAGEALDQAIRELLLLQSSDWPFILKTGTATRYAEARIRSHVHRLRHLGHLVETGRIEGEDAPWLDDVCRRDNFLAQLARRRAARRRSSRR